MAFDQTSNAVNSIGTAKFEYAYPNGLDLDPRSELHGRLVTKIMDRAMASSRMVGERHDSWEKVDEMLTAFIPTDAHEDKVTAKDPRKPVSIVMPVTYATLEILLSNFASAFLVDPIFRYEGVGPEDVTGAIMMEHVVRAQCQRKKIGLNLHTQWRDAFAYGLGAAGVGWETQKGWRSVTREKSFFDSFAEIFRKDTPQKLRESTIIYEGNVLTNINPYTYLPDPNVAVQDVQKGEYVGWLDRDNALNLRTKELSDNTMFNAKYLKLLGEGQGLSRVRYTVRSKKPRDDFFRETESGTSNAVDVIYMYVNLIPEEWELGDGENPEKWMFALGADQIIIIAQPLNLNHNQFPLAVCAPDYDGYSSAPLSRMEVTHGLQHAINYLMNAHIANIRKALNNQLVVDPKLVNINDILDPLPGGVIRLRKAAWGRGVKDGVHQLVVKDVTKGNVGDMAVLKALMESAVGAEDSLQGNTRQGGERVTATEVSGNRQAGLSRLDKAARIASMQSMQEIAMMLASNTAQMMTEETYIKIAGRSERELREIMESQGQVDKGQRDRVRVKPSDLDVFYDVLSHDSSMGDSENVDAWVSIFQVLAGNPEVAARFNMHGIFKHLARMTGVKNLSDFELTAPPSANVQVLPDEQVAQQVQAGNLVGTG